MKHIKFISILLVAATLAVAGCGEKKDDNRSLLLLLLGGGDTVINIAAIPGVTPPNYGETPVTAITETAQYTGTVTWSPTDNPFAGSTVYTATITLTAKFGYTLTGVAANFFTVAGATSVSNTANSGVVTAVFPPTAVEKATYTADGVSFVMAYVPGGKTFPTGTDDLGTPATVPNAYWIGETEVTYELWYKVYTWATDAARGPNQYTFAHAGIEGNSGSGSAQQPVTTINWRDSMVFCNALTEWYNSQKGTTYQCVYCTDSVYTIPLRAATDSTTITWESGSGPNDGTQDDPFVNPNAKGFRLLTSNEWELAARWRNDATNTVSGYTNPYFTKGNSASGAYTYCYDVTDTNPVNGVVDGKDANDIVAVYYSYWNGSSLVVTGVSGTAEVKSKGTSGANSLGLYDMSGNVWEWCFDWNSGSEGSSRVLWGGSWYFNAYGLEVGDVHYGYPDIELSSLGFRFARTQ